MRNRGRTLTAFVVVLVLGSSPLLAAREADATDAPPPRPAPALFPRADDRTVFLSRVYANADRDDEFVELGNGGLVAIDLNGWSLTDGEATAAFPLDAILPARGRLLVARNSTAYAEDTLASADFAFERGDARRMEGGGPRLANAGDEVRLFDPSGALIDAYVWGDSVDSGPGWTGRPAVAMGRGEIAVRNPDGRGGWTDSDTAEDWEGLRRYRLGQSAFDPAEFELRTKAMAILSPDEGDRPLLSFLGSATATIDLAVYTFTSERIAALLADMAGQGVRIRVLLDGAPVGGIEDAEHRVVAELLAAGVEVRWLTGGANVIKRYRYLHAKYAIVDGRAAWIGSENFGPAGFPSEGGGNRGWSVVIEDGQVAATLGAIFATDFNPDRPDSIEATAQVGEPLPAPPKAPRWPGPLAAATRSAQIVIAPDTALDPSGLLGLIASARDHVWIEVFYLDEEWDDHANPFLEAAFDAGRRGVSVRILLDGSWSSLGEDSTGNDAIVERLNRRARNETLDLEARLLVPRGRIERLHNKGLVVDGSAVLVSSMNWAHGSATENREIGIILNDPDLASVFEASYLADWEGRPTSGPDTWPLDDPLVLLGVYAFVGVASAISLRKLRVGNKGIKPPARVRRRASPGAGLRGRPREVRLLPVELVAQPRARAGGRSRARRGRKETRGRLRGPEGD